MCSRNCNKPLPPAGAARFHFWMCTWGQRRSILGTAAHKRERERGGGGREREREARLPDQRQLHIKKGAGWGWGWYGSRQQHSARGGGGGGDKLRRITDNTERGGGKRGREGGTERGGKGRERFRIGERTERMTSETSPKLSKTILKCNCNGDTIIFSRQGRF